MYFLTRDLEEFRGAKDLKISEFNLYKKVGLAECIDGDLWKKWSKGEILEIYIFY